MSEKKPSTRVLFEGLLAYSLYLEVPDVVKKAVREFAAEDSRHASLLSIATQFVGAV
jgi:hypothetical protein